MNNQQIHDTLTLLVEPPKPFAIILSGKKSKKVNGLYEPDTAEIVIHNKNFNTDNLLLYTAIHEYAHHLMFSRGQVKSCRAHTTQFWAIYHSLIKIANEKGYIADPFALDPDLVAKDKEIKEIRRKQIELQKELGRKLLEMKGLCSEKEARFDDYLQRVARIPKKSAAASLALQLELPEIDNMVPEDAELLSSLKGDDRSEAISRIRDGESTEQIVAAVRQHKSIDPAEDNEVHEKDGPAELKKERGRIVKTIDRLQLRLDEIDKTLEQDPRDMFTGQEAAEASDGS